MFVTGRVENIVREGKNAGFSSKIPLFIKTLKMMLHESRKSPTAVGQVESRG